MKKKLNYSLIAILVLAVAVIVETILLVNGALTKVPKNQNGEEILVSLKDGTNISVDDIYKKMKGSYGLNTILDEIDKKILTSEYADKKNDVDTYANNVLNNLKANYKSDEEMLEALQNYGYNSVDDYLEIVKTSQYTNYASIDYAKTLIKDDEVKKYYNEKYHADITGEHILVKPASTSKEDQDKAKKKAEEVIKAINADVKKGTSLQEAFRKYKDDKTVTYQNLGTFNYKEMDEAFSKAAYALKNNEMSSSPVKSSFGYHIILKTAEETKKSLEDAKEEIKEDLAEEKLTEDTTLQAKAMIALREKYDFKINDADIKQYYQRYINRQVNTK